MKEILVDKMPIMNKACVLYEKLNKVKMISIKGKNYSSNSLLVIFNLFAPLSAICNLVCIELNL